MSRGTRLFYACVLLVLSGILSIGNLYRLVHETGWSFFFTFVAIGLIAGFLGTVSSDMMKEEK